VLGAVLYEIFTHGGSMCMHEDVAVVFFLESCDCFHLVGLHSLLAVLLIVDVNSQNFLNYILQCQQSNNNNLI